MIKQSSKRLFSMILALVFIVAAFLFFFDLIQPTYGELELKKGQQVSNQNFLVAEQTAVTQAKKLLAQFQTESQGTQNLALAMPSGPNVAGALAQVYGIAQNSNITIKSINISPPTVQFQAAPSTQGGLTGANIVKPIGNLSLQILGAGTYENFKNFLIQLESNIRIFDVKALGVQPASPAVAIPGKAVVANPDSFTYNVTLVTYYQLP